MHRLLLLSACISFALASNVTCPGTDWSECTCLQVRRVGMKMEIANGFCVTYSKQDDQCYGGYCPFLHSVNSTDRKYSELPNDHSHFDEVMCGPYNRKGFQCGECVDGFGPAVYSLDLKCANCTDFPPAYALGLFLILKLVPGALFFICLVVFNLNITSGPLLGYVLFCQMYAYTLQQKMFVYNYILLNVAWPLRVLLSISIALSDFWNLHFFKSVIPAFCISDKLTGIHIQMLNLAATTYPVILVIITCILMELHARNCRIIHILWKPFSIILNKTNTTAVTGDAVIQAFASFILLSVFTVLYSINAVLEKSRVFQSSDCTVYKDVLYFDPTLTWLGHRHILYAILALVPFIFLLLIPSLLLSVYPTRLYRQISSRCLSARKRLAITTFAEALHRCFKDGLNGTRDYRCLPGVFLIAAVVGPLIISDVNFIGTDLIAGFTLILIALLLAQARPCKSTTANFSLSYHSMVAGALNIFLFFWKLDVLKTMHLELILIVVPVISHVVVLSWAGYMLVRWAASKCGGRPHCMGDLAASGRMCCFQQRHGYEVLLDM